MRANEWDTSFSIRRHSSIATSIHMTPWMVPG